MTPHQITLTMLSGNSLPSLWWHFTPQMWSFTR